MITGVSGTRSVLVLTWSPYRARHREPLRSSSRLRIFVIASAASRSAFFTVLAWSPDHTQHRMPFRPSSRAQRGDLPFSLFLHGLLTILSIACPSVRHRERSAAICLFTFRRIATPLCLKPISVSEFLDGKTVRNDEERVIACPSVRHRERSVAICLFRCSCMVS